MSLPAIITTTLNEIRSFNPCADGWRNILKARNPQSLEDYDTPFPLVKCLESNSISDVCWLIRERKKEISICVKFARMCADSVAHLNNSYSRRAAAYAAYAATTVAATTVAAAAADDAAAAVAAATTDDVATTDDAATDDAYDVAYNRQKEKNKQFLIQCINEFTPE